jgi:hypothetical protein
LATPNGNFDEAINSVLAFAVPVRFDDESRRMLASDLFERPHFNAANLDLLLAIEHTWHRYGSSSVVDLVAREASHFLPVVASLHDLRASVRKRLIDFRSLCQWLRRRG